MNNVTFGDLVKYAVANRRGNAFKIVNAKFAEGEIAADLYQSYTAKTLFYISDEEGIAGIASCSVDGENKIFRVKNLLTTKKGVLKMFVKFFSELFPGYTITAKRFGREVTYNTEKFCNKIMKEAK